MYIQIPQKHFQLVIMLRVVTENKHAQPRSLLSPKQLIPE